MFDLSILRAGDDILVANNGSKFGNVIEKRQLKVGFKSHHAEFVHIEPILIPSEAKSLCVAPPWARIVTFTKRYSGRRVAIIRHFEDREKADDYAVWMATRRGFIYDIPGLAAFCVPIVKQLSWAYFCSECALWAKRKVNPKAFGKIKPSKCMPAESFLPGNYHKIIWEGIIP